MHRFAKIVIGSSLFVAEGAASVQAAATYTFESLTTGTDLAGQDNWVAVGFGSVSPTVGVGTGVNATKIAQGKFGFAGIARRTNDANFSFPQFSGNETAAVSQFDVFDPTLTPFGNLGSYFAMGHGSGIGPLVGFNAGTSAGQGGTGSFDIREAQNGVNHYAAFPASVNAGDWLRLTFTQNFTANGGDGAGSLSYQDLTTGTPLTPVAGLQNINLKLSNMPAGTGPSTWDYI